MYTNNGNTCHAAPPWNTDLTKIPRSCPVFLLWFPFKLIPRPAEPYDIKIWVYVFKKKLEKCFKMLQFLPVSFSAISNIKYSLKLSSLIILSVKGSSCCKLTTTYRFPDTNRIYIFLSIYLNKKNPSKTYISDKMS